MANATPLKKLADFVQTTDGRAPRADISRNPELFGDIDVEDGDIEYDMGDADYGDADYGDADTLIGGPVYAPLSTYDQLIGDGERTRMGKLIHSKGAKYGAIAAGTALTGLAAVKAAKAIHRKRVARAAERSASKLTIQNSIYARETLGKIPRNAKIPFFSVMGATLNASPISAKENFIADSLKFNLDKAAQATPFEVEIASGSYAGTTWTVTTVNAGPRYYSAAVLIFGINALNGAPGTVITLTGSMPLENGTLVISTQPFSLTMLPGYYTKFMIYPWVIVTNKALLAAGYYGTTPGQITFSATGLPSTATVTMVIPGSQHTSTIALRNRLL